MAAWQTLLLQDSVCYVGHILAVPRRSAGVRVTKTTCLPTCIRAVSKLRLCLPEFAYRALELLRCAAVACATRVHSALGDACVGRSVCLALICFFLFG
ncbi:Uncharacterised protein [Vibrio cholerae]|nr:Uncharacterised protein [Vibrio cholerae]